MARTTQWRRKTAVTVETDVDEATARMFHRLYVETFGDLVTKAVARQLLHEDEFMATMRDPRVDKYLAWDEHGSAVAMCTLTRRLETIPWISPEYFAHHFPEHTARDAVYYLGFILVGHRHRRSRLFSDLIRQVAETVVDNEGMCAYDICSHNIDDLGLADWIRTLLQDVADIDVAPMDSQVYFRAIPQGPVRRR
jgi:hypothetical protein